MVAAGALAVLRSEKLHGVWYVKCLRDCDSKGFLAVQAASPCSDSVDICKSALDMCKTELVVTYKSSKSITRAKSPPVEKASLAEGNRLIP